MIMIAIRARRCSSAPSAARSAAGSWRGASARPAGSRATAAPSWRGGAMLHYCAILTILYDTIK